MHSTAPLVRSVVSAVAQQPSRIPHIRLHIFQRQARSITPPSVQRPALLQQQKRRQSTAVHLEDYRSYGSFTDYGEHENARADGQNDMIGKTGAIPNEDGSTILNSEADRYAQFSAILQTGSPDLIELAFFDEVVSEPFIQHATDEIFEKALLMLDPSHLIDHHKRIYRHIRNRQEEGPDARGVRDIEERFDRYDALFRRIIASRHEGKHALTLEICKHMLKWASSLGNEILSSTIFDDVMKLDKVEPDVDCYNYYMQAMNWSHAYKQAEKFALRVLPRHLEIRGSRNRPAKLSGFRTANASRGSVGIREEILQAFKRLVEEGHTANEHTFINMMIAMGREGDIKGVKSILKSVWNIDLGMLEQYDEDEVESPTFYDEGSVLRPSEDLLFALAHIFGSNNDARTAWLLVDYVSRNYALQIPRRVWTELLEWYMVLTLRRSGVEKTQGSAQGRISDEVFAQLFAVMCDAPHNVQPDTVAYYLQSRVGYDQRHLDKQVETARNLRAALDQSSTRMRRSMTKVSSLIKRLHEEQSQDLWTSAEFLQARRDFINDSLEFEANLSMMQHALCQHLLRSIHWAGARKLTEWQSRRLPQLVEEFSLYLPKSLQYRTTGGLVSIIDLDFNKPGAREPHSSTYKLMVRYRKALDTENHDELLEGVKQLRVPVRLRMTK